MSSEQTRVASMTHEKRAREIADGLAGYIGNPKRRDELAEDIVDALRAVEQETWEKAAVFIEQHHIGLYPDPPFRILLNTKPGDQDENQHAMAAALRAEGNKAVRRTD